MIIHNIFPKDDVIYGPWTFWSSCDKDCGYGTMSRYRTCLNESQECDVEKTRQDKNCNEFPCQIDGSKSSNSWTDLVKGARCPPLYGRKRSPPDIPKYALLRIVVQCYQN